MELKIRNGCTTWLFHTQIFPDIDFSTRLTQENIQMIPSYILIFFFFLFCFFPKIVLLCAPGSVVAVVLGHVMLVQVLSLITVFPRYTGPVCVCGRRSRSGPGRWRLRPSTVSRCSAQVWVYVVGTRFSHWRKSSIKHGRGKEPIVRINIKLQHISVNLSNFDIFSTVASETF